MNDAKSPEAAVYLDRLRVALRRVDNQLAQEIYQGVTEELAGLSAPEARERISSLGEPESVAQQAFASTHVTTTATRRFALSGALVLTFGWLVVPIIAPAIGATMGLFTNDGVVRV